MKNYNVTSCDSLSLSLISPLSQLVAFYLFRFQIFVSTWGLSTSTKKHCIFGHLGLDFIGSCFVFCMCLFVRFLFTLSLLRHLKKEAESGSS